jgi:hypothetical protein
MASIIKVDTIQTAAGGTPTAADLGLNTTGSVLQVVQSTFGSEVDVSSSTYVDSGLSGTITPTSTSSKILILVTMAASGPYETSGAHSIGKYRLYDTTASTEIYGSTDRMYDYGGSGGFSMKNQVITTLYSPSTTSATTIKLQMKLNAGDQFRINNDGSNTGGPSVMILQEIAG